MLTIQNTLDESIKTVFHNGELLGEITHRQKDLFEATHVNGTCACFNSFEACKQIFEEVIKPTIKRNNQLNLF